MLLKRFFDCIFAFLGLLLTSPVFAILGMMVIISMGRPIFFRQARAGFNGREFTLVKFRSMREAYNDQGVPLPDTERITKIGRILRRYRLDELPELWPIAVGEMSFVGPRPLPTDLIKAAGILQMRSQVRPGLTGLSQVSGNTLLSNDEKFAIDLYYVNHFSLWKDLRILVATISMIVGGERRNEPVIRRALQYASSVNWGSR